VRYYHNPKLDDIKERIDAAIREGVHSLRASYLSRKYDLDPRLVQQVLSDLVATGDLMVIYELLCSGEHQNFDVDREFDSIVEMPKHEITCSKCGDRYLPDEENVVVRFEPTDAYLEALMQEH
jgi:hypothetical protein